MKKALLIVGIIVSILIALAALGYGYFIGFTKKQKYESCARICDRDIGNSSNIPACKWRCEEMTEYIPQGAGTVSTENE